MLLAIDTATRQASLALYDASGVVAERSWRSANHHSVEVMPAIADMLAQQRLKMAALRAVAVSQGPGSFTGLRIGMSIAKGLCLGLDIPILGVPTLDTVAYAAGDPGIPVVAVLEAGRGRLCVATYHFEGGWPVRVGDWALVTTSDWMVGESEPVLVAGEVSPDLADRLYAQPHGENVAVTSLAGSVRRAGYLAEMAWGRHRAGQEDDLAGLGPLYTNYPSSGTQPILGDVQ
ncbi:MAG: tRNA (adenosine(37)-N6)-threonylcarbamoyltransferase complex dimerization subunit type 1 TsaB [Anaerolineae bacterium]